MPKGVPSSDAARAVSFEDSAACRPHWAKGCAAANAPAPDPPCSREAAQRDRAGPKWGERAAGSGKHRSWPNVSSSDWGVVRLPASGSKRSDAAVLDLTPVLASRGWVARPGHSLACHLDRLPRVSERGVPKLSLPCRLP